MSISAHGLQALAEVLPPNFRIKGDPTGVVSALAQVAEHGPKLLEHIGNHPGDLQAIADFYHEVAVAHAEAAGDPAPLRGAPAYHELRGTPAGVAQPAVSQAQFAELMRQVQELATAVRSQSANLPTEEDLTRLLQRVAAAQNEPPTVTATPAPERPVAEEPAPATWPADVKAPETSEAPGEPERTEPTPDAEGWPFA